MSSNQQTSTEQILQDIAQSPVCAALDYRRGNLLRVVVELPHNPSLQGEIDYLESPEMYLNQLYVKPELRQKGIATRLISAIAYISRLNNIDYLHGAASSQHSLKCFRKLFGEGSIELLDSDPDGNTVHLPMTVDQAIASLERAEAYEEDPDDRGIDIAFRVSLGHIALGDLERPIIYE